MADSVNNPGDSAELGRLNRALEGVIGDLKGELSEIRSVQNDAVADQKAARKAAAREARERRTATDAATSRQITKAAETLPKRPVPARLTAEDLTRAAERVQAVAAPAQTSIERQIETAGRNLQRTARVLPSPLSQDSISKIAAAVNAAGPQGAPGPPKGMKRLFRGEGLGQWTGGEWDDTPPGTGRSHGRWFTDDMRRAIDYARENRGFLKFVDVPEDVARESRHPTSKQPDYILPEEHARRATEFEAGSYARAEDARLERERQAATAEEIRARRAAAREFIEGTPAAGGGGAPPPGRPPTAAGGAEPERPPRDAYGLPGGGVSLAAAEAADDEARALQVAEQRAETLTSAHKALSTSAAQLETTLAGETRQSQLAGDQMRRHGLLTTEFLNAAARGRTTIRELGVQIGGTIAKFAGWTTAAALTYGGLAAVQQLGTGALDSLEGVNQLQRVVNNLDTGKAQEQFRSLAGEFNLPIGVVTDAAFEASKAFKDQNQILDATRAALQGVKVGELEAGASGKYATAIVRGFKLETSDLGRVLDVVNRLQNQFGGDFGQIFQGVAGAAGSFANTGGTFEELASLIQTGQQVTGKTGNEFATALRRSSEIILRPDRRQTIIDLLGIDPQDSSITDVIRAAQAKVAADPTNPVLLQRLATAISTPELASGRIAPLLRSGALFEQRLADVQANATGSAEQERKRVVQSAREQVAELTNQLQELGSALAQAGAGGGLAVMVESLDQAEEVAIKLVEALNLIPKPLREAALAAAPFLGILAVARRFDAGSLLAGRGGLLGGLGSQLSRNPRARGRAQLLQGLDDERSYLQGRGESARFRTADLSLSAINSRKNLADATKYFKTLDDQAEDYVHAQRRVNVLSARHSQILDDQIEAIADADDIDRRILVNREHEAAVKERTSRRGGREDPYVVARSRGIPFASSIDPRPNQAGLLDATGRQVGVGPLTAAEAKVAQAATAGTATRAAAARARGARIAASIGIDGALVGAFGLYEFVNFVRDQNDAARVRLDRIKNLPRTSGTAIQARDAAQKVLDDQQTQLAASARFGALGGVLPEADAARTARSTANRLLRLNQYQRGYSRQEISQQLAGNLERAGGDQGAAKQALDLALRQVRHFRGLELATTPAEVAKAKGQLKVFIEQVLNPRLSNLSDIAGQFDKQLALATDPTALGNLLVGVNNRLQSRGSSRKLAGQAGAIASRARALYGDTTDPVVQNQLLEVIDQAEQSALKAAQDRLTTALALANGPAGARAARARYVSEARAALIRPVRNRIENVRERIDARQDRAQGIRADARAVGASSVLHDTFDSAINTQLGRELPSGASQAVLRRRAAILASLRAANKSDSRKLRELLRGLGLNRAQMNVIVKEMAQANAQERLDAFDARTDRLQSETATEQDGAELVAKRLRQRVDIVRDLVAKKVLTSADLDRAIAESNNAEKAAAEELKSKALDILKARQALTLATLGASGASEGTLLKTALSQAQQIAAKTPRGKNDGIDYLQAATDVQNAQKALNDYMRQQAQDLISANAELASSKTTNPVTQAVIQLRRDQKLLQYAQTPAEKIRLQAQINNDRRGVSQARTEQAADDIQFALDMDRIDASTAARRFRVLARSVKHNKQLKRDLLRRAKALEGSDSTELELTPGNVRLPTLAEIRRFRGETGGGAGGRGVHVTELHRRDRTSIDQRRNSVVHNRNQIIIHVGRGEADKVFEVLEEALTDVKVRSRARRPG